MQLEKIPIDHYASMPLSINHPDPSCHTPADQGSIEHTPLFGNGLNSSAGGSPALLLFDN